MNLKLVLNTLRQRLVKEHHYEEPVIVGGTCICRDTQPIQLFMTWLESNAEAQLVLQKMGFWQNQLYSADSEGKTARG